MILFPAIDLKDGRCVRLERGMMESATVFNEDPAAQAEIFRAQGFKYLHLVDLDGAFAGKPVNAEAVLSIVSSGSLPVQLGGGIRNMERIAFWVDKGVERVILGTAAIENPQLVADACREFPGKIVVALDERGGRVAIRGWSELHGETAQQAAERFRDTGVAALLHTCVEQDGMMDGMNVEASVKLAQTSRLPVIVSGGFKGAKDIRRIADGRSGNEKIEGVIAGRSLYEKRFNVGEALALCERLR
ncbi:MAG: 1-(5-phosphoribosyl)-5-[(5-phosphoribosylamino)methylideneamino]imidazole-4-carboxamide isomerase [Hyphomicrobiales bacterium]|nr:1-(5-phosphoribosyl)-5-[(5-phosphoribosylamino)methylideneamino]imidazole-4-carboxamide isomerase [Hyphomicrobiales bacterium]